MVNSRGISLGKWLVIEMGFEMDSMLDFELG